jgi:4-amino-4-deoxy-L-arabinose transferase-like glycosyltransferase
MQSTSRSYGDVAVTAARPSMQRAVRPVARDDWSSLALLTCVGIGLFAIVLTGAENLLDNEYRLGACVLDVLQHGNWLCPHDVLGNTDKPPMLTWLAALASWPIGRVTTFTLYLPTALATLGTSWLIALAGGRLFGRRAGLFGGLAFLLSQFAARQMATARWDGLFALTVTVAALAAFRAWTLGRGWTVFWLAAAIATLTKGPLGVVFAGFGLMAAVWERVDGRRKPFEGAHLVGIVLFLLLTVGWFLLAYLRVGPHLVHNMFLDEFVGHMVEHRLAYKAVKPLGDFTWNFAPWSPFAVLGLGRVVMRPAFDDDVRRFERFLSCWMVLGLVLFCLSPHNQARLLVPMIVPAAILAGRELDRLAQALSPRAVVPVVVAATLVMLGFFVWEFHRRELGRPAVHETRAIRELARTVEAADGGALPLTYVADSPFAMQLVLNTMRPMVSVEEAAALLRGDAAAFVVTAHLPKLLRALGPEAPSVHILARAIERDSVYLVLVSNRPALTAYPRMATRVGGLVVTLSGVGLGPTWDDVLDLRRGRDGGEAVIENRSSEPRDVQLRVDGHPRESRRLAPGESWRLGVS